MYSQITPFNFKHEAFHIFDFSSSNEDLKSIDISQLELFHQYVFGTLKSKACKVGLGGWLEKRIVYDDVKHFQGKDQRCHHLGVDIWAEADTPLFCLEDCIVHSFKFNNNLGDYGPTIILQSTSSQLYYLFGHLSLKSLIGLEKGLLIPKGQEFAKIGNYPENGNWPPHLHFQVMKSMEEKEGDFPGVCSENDLEHYKSICLNPYPFIGLPSFLD